MSDFETLGTELEALEVSAEGASRMAAVFTEELQNMQRGLHVTTEVADRLDRGMQRGMKRAVDGLVQQGDDLGEALRNVFDGVVKSAYDTAVTPVTDQVGSMLALGLGKLMGGILPFENGGTFAQGRVMPFAKGGVVSRATTFPMRGGLGLMGEAGPEAILPLARGADGVLGVKASQNRPVNIVVNIQTPDVEGFRRSQGQIATQMSRALARAGRNR